MNTRTPIRLKAGQDASHSKDGWGTVMESNRHQTMVYFNTVGVIRLATSAKFDVVGSNGPGKKSIA